MFPLDWTDLLHCHLADIMALVLLQMLIGLLIADKQDCMLSNVLTALPPDQQCLLSQQQAVGREFERDKRQVVSLHPNLTVHLHIAGLDRSSRLGKVGASAEGG